MRKLANPVAALAPLMVLAGCSGSNSTEPAPSSPSEVAVPAESSVPVDPSPSSSQIGVAEFSDAILQQRQTMSQEQQKSMCDSYSAGDFAADSVVMQTLYTNMVESFAKNGMPLAPEVTEQAMSQAYEDVLSKECSGSTP